MNVSSTFERKVNTIRVAYNHRSSEIPTKCFSSSYRPVSIQFGRPFLPLPHASFNINICDCQRFLRSHVFVYSHAIFLPISPMTFLRHCRKTWHLKMVGSCTRRIWFWTEYFLEIEIAFQRTKIRDEGMLLCWSEHLMSQKWWHTYGRYYYYFVCPILSAVLLSLGRTEFNNVKYVKHVDVEPGGHWVWVHRSLFIWWWKTIFICNGNGDLLQRYEWIINERQLRHTSNGK